MNIRETEMNILNVLWQHGPMPATRLCKILEENISWKRTTTYTVLNKCIEKGFVRRVEPNFICEPAIEKSDVQKAKTADLINNFFDSSRIKFLNAFINNSTLSSEEVEELKKLIEQLK